MQDLMWPYHEGAAGLILYAGFKCELLDRFPTPRCGMNFQSDFSLVSPADAVWHGTISSTIHTPGVVSLSHMYSSPKQLAAVWILAVLY